MLLLLLVLLATTTPAARAFAPPSGQYGTLLSSCGPSSYSGFTTSHPVQHMAHRTTQRAPLCLYSSERGGNVRKSSNNKINTEDDTTKATDKNTDPASSALRSTTTPLSEAEAAQQSQVRWDELLEATAPLTCEDGDEECQLLQLEELWEKQQHDKITVKDYCIMGSFVTAMTAAFVWLVSVSGPGGWKYYLAGGLCAAASHVIPVPIDVVKTRKQVDPELASQSFPLAFSHILRTEGVGGLLSGLGPTAVGYLVEGAIKYGIYEILKPVVLQVLARLAVWSKYLAFLNSTVTAFSISAAISGIAASIMLLPMEALRIRMVANPEKRSRGWLVTGYKMLKNEGATSMTKAVVPMLSKQVPYTVTKNVSFDFITKMSYAALVSRGNIIGPMSKMVVPCE